MWRSLARRQRVPLVTSCHTDFPRYARAYGLGILERAGVTEGDLREFAARRGGDDDLMSEIYRQVGARLDSTAQR